MRRRSRQAVWSAAIILSVIGAFYACTEGGEGPGDPGPAASRDPVTEPADPADPDPARPDRPTPDDPGPAASRPDPVDGLEDAVVLRTQPGGAPPAAAKRRALRVETPPLPSADGPGASRAADGVRTESRRARASSSALRSVGGAGTLSAAPPAPMASAPALEASRPAPMGAAAADEEAAAAPTKAWGGGGTYGRVAQARPYSRILTAGAVADVDHRDAYRTYLERHLAEAGSLELDLSRRVRFIVVDSEDRPVHDAAIHVAGNGGVATGRTHADGIWDLFPSFRAPGLRGPATVHVAAGGVHVSARVDVPAQGDGGSYVVRLPAAAAASPRRLDLAFLIDVTGSMSDELRYVNDEVTGIVDRVRSAVPGVEVRVAATFYRDRGDSVPLEQIPFSSELSDFVARMHHVGASGGGDYPEDLDSGLSAAMNTLEWSETPAARVLVVIADAPPQRYGDAQYRYADAMADASRRGIRLLPVAASGANREVEFLFRAMGALTSTPYVYLTDDSGVGNPHMEADSDHVSREMFSDMLTRFLIADLQGEGMHA